MLVKIIGAIIVIWLAFSVLSFLVKGVVVLLVVAAVATLGVAAYGAIKGGSRNRQIR
ncbi:hypothetical protein [Actinokineospora enzanensis]|uniref:hypothetical protein n=1 Tax=Actinokineospora enzanensis TaxID=155975 RepID=UPI00036CF03A|nr:hypothetical protein [Actinokineospora enzanensis]